MFSYNNNNYKKYNISNGLLNYKLSKDYLSTSINIFNIYGLFLYEIYSWNTLLLNVYKENLSNVTTRRYGILLSLMEIRYILKIKPISTAILIAIILLQLKTIQKLYRYKPLSIGKNKEWDFPRRKVRIWTMTRCVQLFGNVSIFFSNCINLNNVKFFRHHRTRKIRVTLVKLDHCIKFVNLTLIFPPFWITK